MWIFHPNSFFPTAWLKEWKSAFASWQLESVPILIVSTVEQHPKSPYSSIVTVLSLPIAGPVTAHVSGLLIMKLR
jgi:hypothetical protein